jgi:hypothetical protein
MGKLKLSSDAAGLSQPFACPGAHRAALWLAERAGSADIVCARPGEIGVDQLQLTDFDVDRQLLTLPGTSLLIFTGVGCSSCRWARQHLPEQSLPVERLCWIDAEENGGAVQRYGVFHLPSVFVVRDGEFYGALRSQLSAPAIIAGLDQALLRAPDDLP